MLGHSTKTISITAMKVRNIFYFYPDDAKKICKVVDIVSKSNKLHIKNIDRLKQMQLIQKTVHDCIGQKNKKLEFDIFRLIEEFRTTLNRDQYKK